MSPRISTGCLGAALVLRGGDVACSPARGCCRWADVGFVPLNQRHDGIAFGGQLLVQDLNIGLQGHVSRQDRIVHDQLVHGEEVAAGSMRVISVCAG